MTAGLPSLDFHRFHREELPRRLARWGPLAAEAASPHGCLGLCLPEGPAVSFVAEGGTIRVVEDDGPADTLVELDAESWQGLVRDLESAPGLLYAGRAKGRRGDLMRFVGWEPALRAMFHGIPIYDPERVDLRDRRGAPLDPGASFRLGDDREEMAHFLETAGYLLVKGVFAPDELERLRDGAEALRQRAVPGDKQSWWGRNRAGEEVLCRVIHAGVAPVFRRLHADPRVAEIASLAKERLVARDAERPNGVTVLWKNPAMSEGLSDLPWHRDCGMGGHAVMCPTMVMSTYLQPATPETGELRFLPGSWKTSFGFAEATDPAAPRGVAVAAEAGDVSLHYGDGMHAAPPPTGTQGPFRSSVLMGFTRPGARHHRGEDHYNDVLLQREDGQVEHLARIAGRE